MKGFKMSRKRPFSLYKRWNLSLPSAHSPAQAGGSEMPIEFEGSRNRWREVIIFETAVVRENINSNDVEIIWEGGEREAGPVEEVVIATCWLLDNGEKLEVVNDISMESQVNNIVFEVVKYNANLQMDEYVDVPLIKD